MSRTEYVSRGYEYFECHIHIKCGGIMWYIIMWSIKIFCPKTIICFIAVLLLRQNIHGLYSFCSIRIMKFTLIKLRARIHDRKWNYIFSNHEKGYDQIGKATFIIFDCISQIHLFKIRMNYSKDIDLSQYFKQCLSSEL